MVTIYYSEFAINEMELNTNQIVKDIIYTLGYWKNYINFLNIGLVGINNMNNVYDYIKAIRSQCPEVKIIIISKDIRKFTMDIIKKLIEFSPIKLSFIQEDSKDSEAYIWNVLKGTNYRFIRQGNNLIEGFQFILLDKKKEFDVEVYQHVIQNKVKSNTNRIMVECAQDLKKILRFENYKYMILLDNKKIFKCRIAWRMWKSWNMGNWNQDKNTKERYKMLMKNAILNSCSDLDKIDSFYRYSNLCAICQGCVECIVHQKKRMKNSL